MSDPDWGSYWAHVWVLVDRRPQFEDEAVEAAYQSWDELLAVNRMRITEGGPPLPLPAAEPTEVLTKLDERHWVYRVQLVGGPRKWIPPSVVAGHFGREEKLPEEGPDPDLFEDGGGLADFRQDAVGLEAVPDHGGLELLVPGAVEALRSGLLVAWRSGRHPTFGGGYVSVAPAEYRTCQPLSYDPDRGGWRSTNWLPSSAFPIEATEFVRLCLLERRR